MTSVSISFEEYCVEIENIPYYNFLTDIEFDSLYEEYEKYLENLNDE